VPPVADLKKNPVTKEEIAAQLRKNEADLEEALAHYQSKGRSASTPDQQFIGQHQSRVELHRANLEMFEAEMRQGRTDVRQVIHHAQSLANALIHLGQFDEALEALNGIGGFEADLLRGLAADYRTADERPNDEQCGCSPPTTDVHIDPHGNEVPKKLQVRKHFRGGKFRSVTQGGVVDVHTCGTCGHQNAHPTEDAAHAQLLAARQAAEHNVRVAKLQGHQARAHLEKLGHRGDDLHLAVKEEGPEPPVRPTVVHQ